MKSILRLTLAAAVTVAVIGGTARAADQTWTGIISDSHCGAVHASDIEHGGRVTARECIIGKEGDASIPGCVSAKNGAKFVVVVGQKVYQVSNQDFAGLRVHAAHNVRVTGSLSGDTMTVSKIEMVSAK
jgi:hypothetical protein